MLSTIIVALDGSDFAARAIPHATALARSSGARLVLVRVLAHHAPGSAVDEMEAIQAALNLDAKAIRADGPRAETIVRRVHPVHADDVARAIAEVADEQQAELIVMSTHGRGGLGRWVYGSVADRVLQQSTTPVLLVPPHVVGPLPTDRRLRVLVPLDGSKLAEEAIETAVLLAGTLGGELTLLRVVELPSYPLNYAPYDLDAERDAARQYLQTHVKRLDAQNTMVTARATIGRSLLDGRQRCARHRRGRRRDGHERTHWTGPASPRQRRHRNRATSRRTRPTGAAGRRAGLGRPSERCTGFGSGCRGVIGVDHGLGPDR